MDTDEHRCGNEISSRPDSIGSGRGGPHSHALGDLPPEVSLGVFVGERRQ